MSLKPRESIGPIDLIDPIEPIDLIDMLIPRKSPGSVRVFLSSRKLALDWENVFQIAGFIGDAQSIPACKSRLVSTQTRDLVVIHSIF